MTPENFSKTLLKKQAELQKFLSSLPHYIGKTAVDFFKENFRQGGWRNGGLRRWQPPKRTNDQGNASARYGPLLSRQNELMNSIDYSVRGNMIIIKTDKPYAQIHNEGGPMNITIPVTKQMRKYAWARMYEAIRNNDNNKADRWKAFALTKKYSINIRFTMPQRQFMGNSNDLNNDIETLIQKHLKNILEV